MGYENTFRLKVKGKVTKQTKTPESCPQDTCGLIPTEDLSRNFCDICGTPLTLKEVETDASDDVIREFVNTYKDGDAGYLLNKDGKSRESGSGHNIKDELKEFSTKHPNLIFILSCKWESSMVDYGEPSTDFYFFKNGIEKKAKYKIVYVNPFTDEEF